MLISDFTKAENLSIIRGTTTINGWHYRYSSAFFIPQIPFYGHSAQSEKAEFVARSIRRTKADYIRTNKSSRFIAVVEALLHPLRAGKSLTNTIKRLSKMYQFTPLSQHLPKCGQICYSSPAVAKSAAEPGNSNNRHTANSSTPLIRAFFVCDIHSSNERLETLRGSERPYELGMPKFGHTPILSMVACSGKGSPFAAYRVRAVFQPVTRYRPNPGKFSGSPKNLHTELSAMMYQFIFAAIRRTDLTNQIHKIRISATSELEARKALARDFVLVLAGRINLQNNAKTDRTFHPVQAMEVQYV